MTPIVVLFVWGDINEEMIDQKWMKSLSSNRKMTIRVVIVVVVLSVLVVVVKCGLVSGDARHLLFWKM